MPQWLFLTIFSTTLSLIAVYMVMVFKLEWKLKDLRRTEAGKDIPELFSPFDQLKSLRFVFFSRDHEKLADPEIRALVRKVRVLAAMATPMFLLTFCSFFVT